MKQPVRSLALAVTALVSCLLASCSGSIDTTALMPTNAVSSTRTGQPVIASVSGGTAPSSMLPSITNEDFKEALQSSLVKSGLFKSTGDGGYRIEASIVSVCQPMFGVSMNVQLEVSYALKRGGSTLWTKNIKSTYTAPLGEALVGAVRVRKATEGAARENISILIRSLDDKL